jgi:signal transduction histidine kinase
MATAYCDQEELRLGALHALGILDTPIEEPFERIVQLAKEIFNVPMAAISLVDRNRQWFKSRIGLEDPETPREWSFCTRTIQRSEPFVVTDALVDPYMAASPLVVDGPRIRFYAGAPMQTHDGHNIGALCVMDTEPREDLNERERSMLIRLAEVATSECYSRIAREEAESANRAKSEFLSRVSHELRTPMNAILGFTQLLEMDELTEEQRSSVSRIHNASKHLLGLLNEVLEISRIEAGRLAVEREPVPISPVIADAVELVAPLCSERNIRLRVEPTGEARCAVVADRQKLAQVILNLLSNAIKYNRDEGEVVAGYTRAAGERLRIWIRDTGPGIAADLHPKLFQPFERLDAARTRVSGTGLGLALSKKLVEAMSGSIGVESAAGAGSTFWFELPLVDAPEVRPSKDAASGPAVLYIEDTLTSIHLIRGILSRRKKGIRLISAMLGELGLEMARIHAPSMVLLDLHLPDISGIQVLRKLKADVRTASIPVVVLTADSLPGTHAQVMKEGATGCLSKPVDVPEFLKTIDSILEISKC